MLASCRRMTNPDHDNNDKDHDKHVKDNDNNVKDHDNNVKDQDNHVKIDTALSADPGVTAGGAAGELGTAAQGTVSPAEAAAKLTEPPGGAYGEGHTGNPQALNKVGPPASGGVAGGTSGETGSASGTITSPGDTTGVTAHEGTEQPREDRDPENPAGPGLQPRPDLRGA